MLRGRNCNKRSTSDSTQAESMVTYDLLNHIDIYNKNEG